MSFEIYLQCFGETENLGLRRDVVRALFPVDEAGSELDYWKLRYDSRAVCDIGVNPFATDATKLAGFYLESAMQRCPTVGLAVYDPEDG
jgi:hypothetical protein